MEYVDNITMFFEITRKEYFSRKNQDLTAFIRSNPASGEGLAVACELIIRMGTDCYGVPRKPIRPGGIWGLSFPSHRIPVFAAIPDFQQLFVQSA